MNKKQIVCLMVLCCSLPLHSLFSSLSNLVSYIEHTEEYPEIDNADWSNPDYTSFYKKRVPSIGTKLKGFFGIGRSVFDLDFFHRTLQQVTQKRKEKGFQGEFIQKLPIRDQGSRARD